MSNKTICQTAVTFIYIFIFSKETVLTTEMSPIFYVIYFYFENRLFHKIHSDYSFLSTNPFPLPFPFRSTLSLFLVRINIHIVSNNTTQYNRIKQKQTNQNREKQPNKEKKSQRRMTRNVYRCGA